MMGRFRPGIARFLGIEADSRAEDEEVGMPGAAGAVPAPPPARSLALPVCEMMPCHIRPSVSNADITARDARAASGVVAANASTACLRPNPGEDVPRPFAAPGPAPMSHAAAA